MTICLIGKEINVLHNIEKKLENVYDIRYVNNIKYCKTCEVLIVDFYTMSNELLTFLKKERSDCKIIALQSNPTFSNAKRLLALGVKAYGNSYMLSVHLKSCIETVLSGNIWVYPEFVLDMVKNINISKKSNAESFDKELFDLLTEREKEMVLSILDGLTNQEIAQKHNISKQTVKVHLSKIYQKLQVSNRLELALKFK